MSKTTKPTLITSPVGKLRFVALRNKVKKAKSDTEKTVYAVKLEFDLEVHSEFKSTIEKINPSLIGGTDKRTASYREGKFTVQATTQFYPTVLDASGEEISQEEAPYFNASSSGTGQFVVSPYTKNSEGGTINLNTVQLLELDVGEVQDSASVKEDRLNSLKEMLSKAAGK